MFRRSYASTHRSTPSTFAYYLTLLLTAFISNCSDDGGGGGGGGGPIFNRNDGGVEVDNSKPVDAEDYCKRVCDVADDCDEDFDKQTCSHRCDNQASSIVKLNPEVQADLYECFEDSACKVVNADDFISSCLSEAVDDLEVTKAGKDFCAELEEAADACDFPDYDEDVCLQTTTAFADDVLGDAKVCAGKKCELVVECLEATFTLPGEVDGTTVGLDADGEIASGGKALPAVVALLPETAESVPVSPVSPDVSPNDPDASVPVQPDTTDDEETSDEPTDTSDASNDTSDDPTDTSETSEPAPTDSTFPTDTTETSEPLPTDTTSSEPVPTDSTDTTETDTTDTTDTTETDTTDTTDTTGPDPEACDECEAQTCSDEIAACVNDPGGENTELYNCVEFDSALGNCDDLYGGVGQEAQWDVCYYEARGNADAQSLQLHDAYIYCLIYEAQVVCSDVCQ